MNAPQPIEMADAATSVKKIPMGNSFQRFNYVPASPPPPPPPPQTTTTSTSATTNKRIIMAPAVSAAPPPTPGGLSPEQRVAYEKFCLGENLFITGPGGTGKTHLIQQFVRQAHADNKNVQVCALTGCAAVLLQCNAQTIHSWSGIRLAKGTAAATIANVSKNRKAVRAWKTVQILIVDEVSMMSQKIFDILNKIGQVVRNNPRPFGGIQVVFCGDFFQLGPIGEPDDPETGLFCFESAQWFSVFPSANHLELTTMFRQRDPAYIQILSEVRKGELSAENVETLKKYVKRNYDPENNNGCVLTKLFPVRNRVDYINKMMFDKIENPVVHFSANILTDCRTYLDSGKPIESYVLNRCDELTSLEREREIDQLLSNNNIPKNLELKLGAAVMCNANLDLDKGICNGSQGVIIDMLGVYPHQQPKVKFANGVVFVMPVHFIQSEEYPTLAVGQIPLILSWALTIHKIQGATLSMAQIDIGPTVFEYGQTYVALSRVQSLDGLYLSNFEPGRIRANPKVRDFYQTRFGSPPVSTATS